MTLWVVATAAFVLGVLAANAVRVRRYPPRHVVGRIALGGRGLFFSQTPDGWWWRLRLRPRRCGGDGSGDGHLPPPDGGVREPRWPPGPRPLSGAARLLQPHG